MICLNCGHCCIRFNVMIVKKESLYKKCKILEGFSESDFKMREDGEICEHLDRKENIFICTIHDYPWYKQTPCFQFTQIENNNKDFCRIGNWYFTEGKEYYEKHILKKWKEYNESKTKSD